MVELKSYYEGFFNNSVDAIFVLNNNSFIHCNASALKMFGYEADELIGKHPALLSPKLQTDGKSSHKEIEWNLLLAIKNGHHRFEWLYKKKSGEEFMAEVLFIPVVEHTINIYCVVRDITESKEKEKKIRQLNEDREFILDHIDVFFYRYNVQGIFDYISSTVKNVTGYEDYEWKNSFLRYLTASDINDDIDKNIARVLENKEENNYNIEIYKKDGEKIILHLDEKPYLSEKGEVEGVIGVARNVTRQLQSEGMIYYAKKMETLSDLASGFSHDVNNSLAILKGNIELLKKKFENCNLLDEVYDRFVDVDHSITRVVNTVEKLLFLSQKYDNKKDEVDLNSFILSMTEDLKKVFTKNVNIDLNLLEDEALVWASHYHVTQVMLTIMVGMYNAISNIRRGYETISVNISIFLSKVVYKSKAYYKIEIDGTNNNTEYTFSLQSVHEILKKEGGFLMQYDKHFHVYFPQHTKRKKIEKEEDDLLSYMANGETVLVVDDELLIVKTSSEILKNFGFNVIFALNGRDGLKFFEKNIEDISLVIIDMDMPDMDGRELYYRLKEIKEDIRIIVSSGYREDKRVLELIQDQKLGFIPKPYTMNLFLKEVIRNIK